MKRIILAAACCLTALFSFAKEAELVTERYSPSQGCLTEWTPFALTLFGPVGLPWGEWNVNGLQIGVFNSANELSGLQIGAVNTACELSGVQIGVVNLADRARGLQIGLVNVIATDDVPFLPIVNWSF